MSTKTTILTILTILVLVLAACAQASDTDATNTLAAKAEELEYYPNVAKRFAEMVLDWKDGEGRPAFLTWKKELDEARSTGDKELISRKEREVLEEMSITVRQNLEFGDDGYFHLHFVMRDRKSQCDSSTEISWIISNCLGISAEAIDVRELFFVPMPKRCGHVACLCTLANGMRVQVDLARVEPSERVSQPFDLEREFDKNGNYWELKAENTLMVNRRFRPLDTNGLIALRSLNWAAALTKSGKPTEVIAHARRAIELDSNCAQAYNSLGVAYCRLAEKAQDVPTAVSHLKKAVPNFRTACKLDEKLAHAYQSMGLALAWLGRLDDDSYFQEAKSNYEEAARLMPNADAFNDLGYVCKKLGRYEDAIVWYNRAIELNPGDFSTHRDLANAYIMFWGTNVEPGPEHKEKILKAIYHFDKAFECNPEPADLAYLYHDRGNAFVLLGGCEPENREELFGKARVDYQKALELGISPEWKKEVERVNGYFKLGLDLNL